MNFIVLLVPLFVFSKTEKNSVISDITAEYKKAGYVRFQAEKSVKSELMGKETTHKGTFYYSGGKLRWESDSPEKSLMVYDGMTLWNVQYPSPDFPGDIQAGRSKIDKKNRQQVLLAEFIGLTNLEKNFNIQESTQGDLTVFNMKAKEKSASIPEATILVSKKEKKILEISYPDDFGNVTKIKFIETEMKKKRKPELFKYVPDKNVKVTDL